MTTTLRFIFERETKGAVRFQEVDTAGQALDQVSATVGTLYIRKSALPRGEPLPRELAVTIDTAGAVEADSAP